MHVADIAAMTDEIKAHLDLHDVGNVANVWLTNARSALATALHCVEKHFEAVEAKAKAEVAELEAKAKAAAHDAEPALAAVVNKFADENGI